MMHLGKLSKTPTSILPALVSVSQVAPEAVCTYQEIIKSGVSGIPSEKICMLSASSLKTEDVKES